MNLYKAFCEAKRIVMERYAETAALYVTLPWIHDEIKRTKEILSEDWWPYGIRQNRHVLETFLRYHHEQGLSQKLMTIEELFAFETLDEEFKI